MLARSRSVRFAALALAVTAPLVATTALPAFAAGEYTTAELTSPDSGSATTFTWDYTFHQNGGNGLSNIAIGFCSADILNDVESASAGNAPVDFFLSGDVEGQHAGFGPGIKFDGPADSSTITVTFKNPHPISEDSFRIQSHSGGGRTPDATKVADGPGPCPGDPIDNGGGDNDGGDNGGGDNGGGEEVVDNGGGDNGGGNNGGGNNGGGNNTGVGNNGGQNNTGGGNTNSSDPTTTSGPSVDVLGITLQEANAPAPSPALSPVASPALLGETLAAGGDLPRTGAANVPFLMTFALSLLAAGLTLRIFGRRTRSASSPG